MANKRKRLLRPLHREPSKSSDGFNRKLITPMIVGAVLNPINSSIIAVSLVPIGTAFGAAPSSTAWLVSGLYLATALGQPVVGKLVDVYGPKRLYLAGAIFTPDAPAMIVRLEC
jgi:MFS family permease